MDKNWQYEPDLMKYLIKMGLKPEDWEYEVFEKCKSKDIYHKEIVLKRCLGHTNLSNTIVV